MLPTQVTRRQEMSTDALDRELVHRAQVEQELQAQLMVHTKKSAQSDELFRLLVANVRDYAIFTGGGPRWQGRSTQPGPSDGQHVHGSVARSAWGCGAGARAHALGRVSIHAGEHLPDPGGR